MRKHEDIRNFCIFLLWSTDSIWFKCFLPGFFSMFPQELLFFPYQAHHVMHPGLPTPTRTDIYAVCNMIRCGPVTETTPPPPTAHLTDGLEGTANQSWACDSANTAWRHQIGAAEMRFGTEISDIGEFTASHNDINWLKVMDTGWEWRGKALGDPLGG